MVKDKLIKFGCSSENFTPGALGKLLLWLATLWALFSILYLLAGLLIVLHLEASIINIFNKFEPLESITAIATVASAIAAFMSYRASVKASEIASKIGFADRRRDVYLAFLALKHHLISKTYWSSEAEVTKFYHFSIHSRFLFKNNLSEKIEQYYDACLRIAINHSNEGNGANLTNKGKEAMAVALSLSGEIEREILSSLA